MCRNSLLETSHGVGVHNRRKALQRHIDVPKREEQLPVIGTIRHMNIVVGDQTGTLVRGREPQSPRYADVGQEKMTPELILQYRARISSGVYDAPASIHALALALLAGNVL